jgi:hypothetical protein
MSVNQCSVPTVTNQNSLPRQSCCQIAENSVSSIFRTTDGCSGIADELIRISVGLESFEMLRAEFDVALGNGMTAWFPRPL